MNRFFSANLRLSLTRTLWRELFYSLPTKLPRGSLWYCRGNVFGLYKWIQRANMCQRYVIHGICFFLRFSPYKKCKTKELRIFFMSFRVNVVSRLKQNKTNSPLQSKTARIVLLQISRSTCGKSCVEIYVSLYLLFWNIS